MMPWNRGLKGIHLSLSSEWKKGHGAGRKTVWIKKNCPKCSKVFYVKPSLARVVSCSRSCAFRGERMGTKHHNWKGGIKFREKHSLFNPEYVEWRSTVFKRDSWKCKIADENCNGQLEAHHILPWRDFVELRYQINNGITLCHYHHPRKSEEVVKLSPYFQELVASLD